MGLVFSLSHLHFIFTLWEAVQPHLITTLQALIGSPSRPTQQWSRPLAPVPSLAWASWPFVLLIVVRGCGQKAGPHGHGEGL